MINGGLFSLVRDMNGIATIYGIFDERDNVRYVGGTVDFENRKTAYQNYCDGRLVHAWCYWRLRNGLAVRISKIDTCQSDSVREIESRWIRACTSTLLLNTAEWHAEQQAAGVPHDITRAYAEAASSAAKCIRDLDWCVYSFMDICSRLALAFPSLGSVGIDRNTFRVKIPGRLARK